MLQLYLCARAKPSSNCFNSNSAAFAFTSASSALLFALSIHLGTLCPDHLWLPSCGLLWTVSSSEAINLSLSIRSCSFFLLATLAMSSICTYCSYFRAMQCTLEVALCHLGTDQVEVLPCLAMITATMPSQSTLESRTRVAQEEQESITKICPLISYCNNHRLKYTELTP